MVPRVEYLGQKAHLMLRKGYEKVGSH